MNASLRSDILQWDVKSWGRALDFWEANTEWSKVHIGLELGGNRGGLSLWLALKGINVVCSDLENVQASAEPLHKQHKVSGLITYRDVDATNIPYENHFDLIVFKSIIGGIGRGDNYEIQKKVFKEIHKALKPGGQLLFAENLSASALHRGLRKKFVNWGDSWRYVSLSEMSELLKDFSKTEIKTTGVSAAFGRSEGQRRFFSSIDSALLNKLSPNSWKYIAYGVAAK